MSKHTSYGILSLTLAILLTGCQGIGNNMSYMLKYKKDLIEYYQENIEKTETDIAEATKTEKELEKPKKTQEELKAKQDQLVREANVYLPTIYSTNIPFSLSNHYDTREPKRNGYQIRKGDPVSIIINKVFLANNGEQFAGDTGEIAVVVSVDDGEGTEPKNVLVAYEEGIKDNIFLPISDLIAYHAEAYADQPIKINVTVFELDQRENDNYRKLLGTAAEIGSTLMPAYTPAISVAAKIGDFLIAQNKDDVIAKFCFQLYPWEPGPVQRVTQGIGVPRISYGHFLILNVDQGLRNNSSALMNIEETVHVGFDLNAYQISLPTVQPPKPVVSGKTVTPWPLAGSPAKDGIPLPYSYVVLTISKTQAYAANVIISRSHEVNKTLAGLTKLGDIQTASTIVLGKELDSLNSGITIFIHKKEFDKTKDDPRSLRGLLDLLGSDKLTETDKKQLARDIYSMLPDMPDSFKTANSITPDNEKAPSTLNLWYTTIAPHLAYDRSQGSYSCSHKICKKTDDN